MAMLPPTMVDQGKGSPNRITENTIAVTGTTYMNADAFSDPSLMVVWKKTVVPIANDTTEIIRKFTQKIQSNVNTDNSLSLGTKENARMAEKR